MPKKEIVGTVVSNKMNKTIVVAVHSKHAHPRFGKIVGSTQKFKAHDEHNQCNVGDKVRIIEHRPISKEKTWILGEVVEQAEIV